MKYARKEKSDKIYKVLLLVYNDECFLEISSAKDLRNIFQKHKAGKEHATAHWLKIADVEVDCFEVYLLEETKTLITRESANNLLLAWIKYYTQKNDYKVCNTELNDMEIIFPKLTLIMIGFVSKILNRAIFLVLILKRSDTHHIQLEKWMKMLRSSK